MLNWWIKSGYKLEYTNKGIDIASARGLIHILNWWKNSGLELKYSEKAINDASHNNFVNVLKWWKESEYIQKMQFIMHALMILMMF